MTADKISTGCPELDELIGGGLERKVITQFYGEPAAGKSTIALMCVVSVLKSGRSAIVIDSEGFSVERFCQICGEDAKALSEKLLLYEPSDFDQQSLMIRECSSHLDSDVGIIVLDSATALYRVELTSSGEVQRRLGNQMVFLLGYAKRLNIPVVITNQVFTDIDTGRLTGLGGTSLEHISKVIVRVEKFMNRRRAILEKHRSMPEGSEFGFKIVKEGIVAADPDKETPSE